MKQFEYDVWFEGDRKETVSAFTYSDAVIKASTARMNKGFHYCAIKVILNETGEFRHINPKSTITVNYL
jgi:hypothetical protein